MSGKQCRHCPLRPVYPSSASVAQLDARPTGDQEVAGSIPAESATFFHGELIMNYFLWFLPSADPKRAFVRFW